ncbi:MAG: AraC family transcriptional regulator [Verrucomicrobiota bacterium]
MDTHHQRALEFFRRVAEPDFFAQLFDHLPQVFLYVKDRQHRFVRVNSAMAQLCGCSSTGEVLGKSDHDFSPPALADQYVEEDRQVMRSKQPLVDQVWLVPDAAGIPCWYFSTKLPIPGRGGQIIGIAGVMRPHDQAGDAPGDYRRMSGVCDHVLAHYGEPVTVPELAAKANLSVSQLQREFRRLFHMSPANYIQHVRLTVARRELSLTCKPAGRIALDCGFYDQSHFTRTFRSATGMSPSAYRRRFAGL